MSFKLCAQDVSEIYKADTIYFYGYDFSHVVAKTKHPINDCIFPWIFYTTENNPPSYFEKRMYMNVIHDFSYTNSINKELIEKQIVGGVGNALHNTTIEGEENRYHVLFENTNNSSLIKEHVDLQTIPNENIKKYLSEYKLKQRNGIGLVCFISEINKVKETILVQFIFFDIKTRHVYAIIDKSTGGATGIGMENHWKHSFAYVTHLFLKKYKENLFFDYRKEYKRKKKRMREGKSSGWGIKMGY